MLTPATQVTVTLFVRGPLLTMDAIDAVLAALEATTLFRPTSFGRDERKRAKYQRAKAIDAAVGARSLFLWHPDMLADASQIELGEENPLSARFSFSLDDRERVAASLVADAHTLVDRLLPVTLHCKPTFDGAAISEAKPELWKRLSETRPPHSPELVQRLGLGDIAPATYIDDEIANAMGDEALRELDAQRRGAGFWIIEPTAALLDDMQAWIEARGRARELLTRRGLAGRVGLTPQMPTYFGPNWKAPKSWTRKLAAVAERRVVGPNV